MDAALARGAMDGIITSPGGWGKNVRDAPSANLVPGLLYTYFLIATRRGSMRCQRRSRKRSLSPRARVTEKVGRNAGGRCALDR